MFYLLEEDRCATMAEANAEYARNSGGRLLFDDGMFQEERDEMERLRQSMGNLSPFPDEDIEF